MTRIIGTLEPRPKVHGSRSLLAAAVRAIQAGVPRELVEPLSSATYADPSARHAAAGVLVQAADGTGERAGCGGMPVKEKQKKSKFDKKGTKKKAEPEKDTDDDEDRDEDEDDVDVDDDSDDEARALGARFRLPKKRKHVEEMDEDDPAGEEIVDEGGDDGKGASSRALEYAEALPDRIRSSTLTPQQRQIVETAAATMGCTFAEALKRMNKSRRAAGARRDAQGRASVPTKRVKASALSPDQRRIIEQTAATMGCTFD